jgi:hypothetical protein
MPAQEVFPNFSSSFLRHHQVEANTKDTHESTLRLHVSPFIGKVGLLT